MYDIQKQLPISPPFKSIKFRIEYCWFEMIVMRWVLTLT